MLTMHEEAALARAALGAGALAYVVKEVADSELTDAVRRAAVGETHLNRKRAGRLADDRMRTSSWD